MKSYLIVKSGQPEGDYAEMLHARDDRSIASDVVLDLEGTIIERVELTDEEAEDRSPQSRAHILSLEVEPMASVPKPGDVMSKYTNMTPAQARAFHGIDEAHARGVKGKGQKLGIIDSGCGQVYADGMGGSLFDKVSFVPGESWVSDDDTHGEWCLSTVFNCCPEATFGSIKVLDNENGSGAYSQVINGVNHAVQNGYTGISLSLGGPPSAALDAAVNAAEDKGLHVTQAGGNEQRGKTDMIADNTSPARASKPLTIAACNSDRAIADFSNFGSCIDLACLGFAVAADYVSGFWNGTSMATPYAQAGVALVRSAGALKDVAKQAILATARNTNEPAYKEGSGVMDVKAALDSLKGEEPKKPASEFFPDLARVSNVQVRQDGSKEHR